MLGRKYTKQDRHVVKQVGQTSVSAEDIACSDELWQTENVSNILQELEIWQNLHDLCPGLWKILSDDF